MNQVRCEETDESKLDSLSSSANWRGSQNECDFTTLGKLTCQFGEPMADFLGDLRKGSALQRHSAEMRILGLGILRTLHQSRNFCLAEIPKKKCLELHNFFFLASNLAKTATSVGASRNQHPSDGESFPLL